MFEVVRCYHKKMENSLEHLLWVMLEAFLQFVHCAVLGKNIF